MTCANDRDDNGQGIHVRVGLAALPGELGSVPLPLMRQLFGVPAIVAGSDQRMHRVVESEMV